MGFLEEFKGELSKKLTPVHPEIDAVIGDVLLAILRNLDLEKVQSLVSLSSDVLYTENDGSICTMARALHTYALQVHPRTKAQLSKEQEIQTPASPSVKLKGIISMVYTFLDWHRNNVSDLPLFPTEIQDGIGVKRVYNEVGQLVQEGLVECVLVNRRKAYRIK